MSTERQGRLPLRPRLNEVDRLYAEAHPTRCTVCRFLGRHDDFDCMGLDEDMLACPECGHVDKMARYW